MPNRTKSNRITSAALATLSGMLWRSDHRPILKPEQDAFDRFEYIIVNIAGQGYIVSVQYAPTIKGIATQPPPPEYATLAFLNLPIVTFYAFASDSAVKSTILYGPRAFIAHLVHKKGIPVAIMSIEAVEDISSK